MPFSLPGLFPLCLACVSLCSFKTRSEVISLEDFSGATTVVHQPSTPLHPHSHPPTSGSQEHSGSSSRAGRRVHERPGHSGNSRTAERVCQKPQRGNHGFRADHTGRGCAPWNSAALGTRAFLPFGVINFLPRTVSHSSCILSRYLNLQTPQSCSEVYTSPLWLPVTSVPHMHTGTELPLVPSPPSIHSTPAPSSWGSGASSHDPC